MILSVETASSPPAGLGLLAASRNPRLSIFPAQGARGGSGVILPARGGRRRVLIRSQTLRKMSDEQKLVFSWKRLRFMQHPLICQDFHRFTSATYVDAVSRPSFPFIVFLTGEIMAAYACKSQCLAVRAPCSRWSSSDGVTTCTCGVKRSAHQRADR